MIFFTIFSDTNQTIIHFLDKMYSALNKDVPEYILGIFLDPKKAFITVPKSILLRKMSDYGFTGTANKLIESYMSNRTQDVSINGFDFSCRSDDFVVPQGPVHMLHPKRKTQKYQSIFTL